MYTSQTWVPKCLNYLRMKRVLIGAKLSASENNIKNAYLFKGGNLFNASACILGQRVPPSRIPVAS